MAIDAVTELILTCFVIVVVIWGYGVVGCFRK